MTDEELMQAAIAEAKRSEEPLRCGCVIYDGKEIIASTFNSQRGDHDATAHAEIKAIKEAGSRLGVKDLRGCSAFCTSEPCVMCLSAMILAKIDRLYFAVPMLDRRIDIDPKVLLERASHQLVMIPNFLEMEVRDSLYGS